LPVEWYNTNIAISGQIGIMITPKRLRDLMKFPEQTQMHTEASQAAEAVRRQFTANATLIRETANFLRVLAPPIIFTCARGSSDHAATFAKYMFETRLRIATVSQAPSISSIYGGPLLNMKDVPFIVISQSGRSPDILMSAEAAKAAGALVIALVNDINSPLAALANIVIPLHAGPETSVAATKSYIATLAAIAHFVAHWSQDIELQTRLETLGDDLASAFVANWLAAEDYFASAQSLFVLGRGLTLGIAQEAALKFKETCGLHAEAFSLAEVAHGPMALIKPGFPLLIFPPQDKAALGLEELVEKFAARGAQIAVAGSPLPGTMPLPLNHGLHPVLAPIAMVQSFYTLVNAISIKRGYDPDHPPMLNKVTETR
jgi:glutamine---fructose-6-phosphate transaminase (isomerizing)